LSAAATKNLSGVKSHAFHPEAAAEAAFRKGARETPELKPYLQTGGGVIK
jgi:hypothetical protein